jgi:hypothetical protein
LQDERSHLPVTSLNVEHTKHISVVKGDEEITGVENDETSEERDGLPNSEWRFRKTGDGKKEIVFL